MVPACVNRRAMNISKSAPESTEPLVGVADEGQAHLGSNVVASSSCLCTQSVAVVVLVDLVDREILGINVGLELRFERSANATQAIPLHAAEEWMLLDLIATVSSSSAAKTMLGVAYQPKGVSVQLQTYRKMIRNI